LAVVSSGTASSRVSAAEGRLIVVAVSATICGKAVGRFCQTPVGKQG